MVKSFYDIPGYIILSLQDNFVDHCYCKSNLEEIISRWDEEGSGCCVYKKYCSKNGSVAYYKFVPVQCYELDTSTKKDIKVDKLLIDFDNIPSNIKVEVEVFREYFLIKDYDEKINFKYYKMAAEAIEAKDI